MNENEQTWRRKAVQLTSAQITTRLWREFQDALNCQKAGDFESVSDWVDETESQFVATYETFEQRGLAQKSDDLDSHAVIAQKFLLEGVEHWLEALAELREGDPHGNVWSKAEWGQRLLIAVQMLKAEAPTTSVETWGF